MNLQSKHIVWIFDAAGQHFTDELARLENELVRHEAMMQANGDKDEVLISIRSTQQTRQDRVDEIKRFIAEYKMVIGFCREAKLRGIDMSAAEFAEAFRGQFKPSKTN